MEQLLIDSFEKLYNEMDKIKVKDQVDEKGIDGFINSCAKIAATVGAVSGLGGALTSIVGLPADLINTIIQQFRVTLAVIYHKTGRYKISFQEFIKIVGISIGVEVGVSLLKNIAIKIITTKATQTAAKSIPLLGAVVGGGANYMFIKSLGKALLSTKIGSITENNIEILSDRVDSDSIVSEKMLTCKTFVSMWSHACMADGELQDEEKKLVNSLIEEMISRTFADNGVNINEINQEIQNMFDNPLSIKNIGDDQDLPLVLYENVCQIVAADGELKEDEKEFLEDLSNEFQIGGMDKKKIEKKYLKNLN